MTIELKINGKIVPAEIDEKYLSDLEQNGYERKIGERYYFEDDLGKICAAIDNGTPSDNSRYDCANYFNDSQLAADVRRADVLRQQIMRYAALNSGLYSSTIGGKNFVIGYLNPDYEETEPKEVLIIEQDDPPAFGELAFSNEEIAHDIIEIFKSELTWYFTKFQPFIRDLTFS